MVDALSHVQSRDWWTHTCTHTQATTISEGQNWPRVKTDNKQIMESKCVFLFGETQSRTETRTLPVLHSPSIPANSGKNCPSGVSGLLTTNLMYHHRKIATQKIHLQLLYSTASHKKTISRSWSPNVVFHLAKCSHLKKHALGHLVHSLKPCWSATKTSKFHVFILNELLAVLENWNMCKVGVPNSIQAIRCLYKQEIIDQSFVFIFALWRECW